VALFGNTATETGGEADWHNYKGGAKFTLSENGDVTKLSVLVANTSAGHGACNIMGLIYADSDKMLEGATAPAAITDNQAKGWVDCTFSSGISLAAGDYWLLLFGDADADGVWFYADDDSGAGGWNADTYVGGPADPMGALTGETTNYAIYATYTASPDIAVADIAVDVDDTLWQVTVGGTTVGWRDITDEVGNLVYSNVRPGGAASASFTVPADVWSLGYNELRPDERLVIRYAGTVVWDGYVLPRGVNYQGG